MATDSSLRTWPRPGWAYAAATVAAFSAPVSTYWSLGGTIGMRSVGGRIADLALSATPGAAALALAASLLKLLGLGFALVLAGRLGRRLRPRWVVVVGWGVAGALTVYGAVNMVGAALVLTGTVQAPGADRYALTWHLKVVGPDLPAVGRGPGDGGPPVRQGAVCRPVTQRRL